MKNAGDVKRAKLLLQSIDDAKEWRETFELEENSDYEKVEFEECALSHERDTATQGFVGGLTMPKDVAAAMMTWLDGYARAELEKIGVKIP